MSGIVKEILDAVASNMDGPYLYLRCYNDLLYIVDGSAKKTLDDYFSLDPLPSLREFGHKIEDLDSLSKEICLFPNKVVFEFLSYPELISNLKYIFHFISDSFKLGRNGLLSCEQCNASSPP